MIYKDIFIYLAIFLKIQKVQIIKEQINKLDYLKFMICCSSKYII